MMRTDTAAAEAKKLISYFTGVKALMRRRQAVTESASTRIINRI